MGEKILIFGGAHIDKEYTMYGEFVPETSNPCWGKIYPGGVGLNIATHLKNLGAKNVAVVSGVGQDDSGNKVFETCDYFGIDASYISILKNELTAEYICGIDVDKNVLFGLANMDIYENIDFDILKPFLSSYQVYPFWVVETNFSKTTIEHLLASKTHQEIFVVATSSVKILKIIDSYSYIDHLFLNEREFWQLTGQEIFDKEECLKEIENLHKKGVKNIYLTRDKRGSLVSTGDKVETYLEPAKVLKRTSGAGDAFASAFIFHYTLSKKINASSKQAALYARDLVEGKVDLYDQIGLGKYVA